MSSKIRVRERIAITPEVPSCGMAKSDSSLVCSRDEGHPGDHVATFELAGRLVEAGRWKPSEREVLRRTLVTLQRKGKGPPIAVAALLNAGQAMALRAPLPRLTRKPT